MEPHLLCHTFLEVTGTKIATHLVPSTQMEDALREMWKRGCDAHPGIALSVETFCRHLGELVRSKRTELSELLKSGSDPDLYLACACLHQLPGAIETFERDILLKLPLRKLIAADEGQEEVRQRTRYRLLVQRDEEPARIGTYSGRGPLAGFVRSTARRLANDYLKEQGRSIELSQDDQLLDSLVTKAEDWHADKTRFGPLAEGALREVIRNLPVESRNLLRRRVLDGLTMEKLGTACGCSQATACKKLAEITAQIGAGIKRRLEQHGLAPKEVASLLPHLKDEINTSLRRMLKSERDKENS